jgi:hypothetical protein
MLAGGIPIGPLSHRVSAAFAKGTNGSDDPKVSMERILYYEDRNGVRLSDFDTICEFSGHTQGGPELLAQSFGNYPTPDIIGTGR